MLILAYWLGIVSATWPFPEQVHVSWTENPGELMVTWVSYTQLETKLAYRPMMCSAASENWLYAYGSSYAFNEGTNITRICYIHKAKFLVLSSCFYEYVVGNGGFWSRVFEINSRSPSEPASEDTQSARFIVLGDWGTGPNGIYTNKLLSEEAKQRNFDAVLHIGDLAYDLNDNEGQVGDQWLNMIEPIASAYPYMTLPGNHEVPNNFTHYINRFSMPLNSANQGTGFFYSFDLGPAHIVMINTEGYFYYNNITGLTQYNWLVEDLNQANLYRNIRPWLVVLTHHPVYCSLDWSESFKACGPDAMLLQDELEELFYTNAVDLVFQAHVHNYERDTPIYKNQTVYGAYDSLHTHVGPKAPIYITSGNAGNCEGSNTPLVQNPQAWSQAWSSDFGYGRLVVENKTHAYWEQFSAQSLKVIDYVWIIKTQNRYN